MNRATVLTGLLIVVFASHLVLGSIAYFASPESVAHWAGSAYGAQLDMNPESRHIVRILGAFMLAIAALTGMALADPSARRAIVSGIVVLLLLRVAQRVIYADEIRSVFGLSPMRIWVQAGLFAALAVALWMLRPARRT
jgi:hypothetical protein